MQDPAGLYTDVPRVICQFLVHVWHVADKYLITVRRTRNGLYSISTRNLKNVINDKRSGQLSTNPRYDKKHLV